MTLNIVVLLPIPSASVTTATTKSRTAKEAAEGEA